MEAYKIAVPVTFIAVLIGLSAGLWFNHEITGEDLDISFPSVSGNSDSEMDQMAEIGPLNSAHEHASFYVVVNGSEKDFTDEKFQFNSRYVHLENNKSNIVHKHAEGLTWEMFFQTINLSASTEDEELCLEIYGNSSCGNGSVVLNGELNASMDQEISQGDSLLIILDTKNWRDISEEYMRKQLPEDYQPQDRRGRSI
jgi:hypothetical protein